MDRGIQFCTKSKYIIKKAYIHLNQVLNNMSIWPYELTSCYNMTCTDTWTKYYLWVWCLFVKSAITCIKIKYYTATKAPSGVYMYIRVEELQGLPKRAFLSTLSSADQWPITSVHHRSPLSPSQSHLAPGACINIATCGM